MALSSGNVPLLCTVQALPGVVLDRIAPASPTAKQLVVAGQAMPKRSSAVAPVGPTGDQELPPSVVAAMVYVPPDALPAAKHVRASAQAMALSC
jgi:hypothetical protein